jgi:hypothetical protein
MDDGNGCTTMCMLLVPLTCTVKMVKVVNFMICYYFNVSPKVHVLES